MTSALANNLFQHQDLYWNGAVTVEKTVALRHELLETLLQSRSVAVDLTDVARIDLAVLQLLCAAQRVAVPQGKMVQLQGVDHRPVAEALALNGFRRRGPCCRECGDLCLWLMSAGGKKEQQP